MEPLLPRDMMNDVAVLIESASMISCGDIKCSDDCCCLLWIIEEMFDVAAVVDDNKFNNPLPLAVKADENGAATMASSAERRPMYIIMV